MTTIDLCEVYCLGMLFCDGLYDVNVSKYNKIFNMYIE